MGVRSTELGVPGPAGEWATSGVVRRWNDGRRAGFRGAVEGVGWWSRVAGHVKFTDGTVVGARTEGPRVAAPFLTPPSRQVPAVVV